MRKVGKYMDRIGKGGTLKLKDIVRLDKEMREQIKGKRLVLIEHSGIILNWHFPFIHPYRAVEPQYI